MIAAMRAATPTLNIPTTAISFSNMPVGGTVFVPGAAGPARSRRSRSITRGNIITPLIRPFFTNGQIHFKVESAMKNEVPFQ